MRVQKVVDSMGKCASGHKKRSQILLHSEFMTRANKQKKSKDTEESNQSTESDPLWTLDPLFFNQSGKSIKRMDSGHLESHY